MDNFLKERVIGRFFQFFLAIVALIFMVYIGGEFLIISLIFFFTAGIFEFLFLNNFVSKKKTSKKPKGIKDSFLWVHQIINFIKKYNTDIYDFKKVKGVVAAFSYFIIFLYILVAFLLFKIFSYYGFIIYTIPIITNIYSFFKNKYGIE
ncbi:MAG: hypothetical protein ABIJ20_04605 [Nanoarchaeota archaeon]|nr:hypothetical protein [Nanoarchaeota archaeon]MBU1445086.1 hypothetical protein [Nanoarchaeota archaeon]MBU2420341.1 hypothetical protein [Nanoarchaeota archaeon]MBU2474949.1 hypothetical protein [Nanoarchaeota archaeon]